MLESPLVETITTPQTSLHVASHGQDDARALSLTCYFPNGEVVLLRYNILTPPGFSLKW